MINMLKKLFGKSNEIGIEEVKKLEEKIKSLELELNNLKNESSYSQSKIDSIIAELQNIKQQLNDLSQPSNHINSIKHSIIELLSQHNQLTATQIQQILNVKSRGYLYTAINQLLKDGKICKHITTENKRRKVYYKLIK